MSPTCMRLSRRTDSLLLGPEARRLVALGDPHGDVAGLDAVLACERRGAPIFVSVGDNVGYADAASASALCQRLAELGIRSVHGNHEAYADEGDGLSGEALAWTGGLPMRLRVQSETALGAIVVVHTLTDDEDTAAEFADVDDPILYDYVGPSNADVLADAEGARVVFCGHSHGPVIYEISPTGAARTHLLELEPGARLDLRVRDGMRYVINAGSLARPGHHPAPGRPDLATYGVVDFSKGTVGLRAVEKNLR